MRAACTYSSTNPRSTHAWPRTRQHSSRCGGGPGSEGCVFSLPPLPRSAYRNSSRTPGAARPPVTWLPTLNPMTRTDDRPGAPDPAGEPAGGRSRWIDLDGPVHYLDFGGPARGPVIVCVHGLGGSAVNWSAIAPLLTGGYRMLAPDLAGHGLTQSLGRGADVAANRALLHRFIGSVSASPVILMGNSMGGMISLLEAGAAPDAVAG